MKIMKKILSGVFILFTLSFFSAAYTQIYKIKPNANEKSFQLAQGKKCTAQSSYLGYVVSVAIGYGGYNKGPKIKNYIAITVVDKNRKNPEWYWSQYDANTDAGKSIQALASYAAASGQKILAECEAVGDHQNINSLWVGPDAW
ncbi:hypothetical protein [Xenorhabdus cabanillasii]|uniref:Uncharacterized protein n=1 Tax=Xenorhabdus cabanillasii JM26 TaxID=1427517 RepID=W1J8F2_9GAMM|nr:hypothetical protein [Xenorhabdus cabanillasii]PHM76714.1 hypothetical protein Xcab_02780 [Xenorhabdus cabanillasii JM26]CDL86984.1 exported hypothetical protein [Xenorhabdus cabanillasii JM26]